MALQVGTVFVESNLTIKIFTYDNLIIPLLRIYSEIIKL